MRDIALRIGSQRFSGWTSLSVTRTMRAASGAFSFSASERNPDDPIQRVLRRGERAEVLLGDELLAVGWIDELAVRYDGESHEISVAGRESTADLVDCSAVHKPGQWRGRRLEAIARDLAEPFGIPVTADVDTGAAFEVFKTEPGEGAFAAIERAARHRAVLPISDHSGGLRLARVGTQRLGFELRKGVNILAGEATHSDRERFSLYRVIGQTAESSPSFTTAPAAAASVVAEVLDAGVERFRPTVLVSEEPGGHAQLADRAAWERSRRRGQALSASLVVTGWEHPAGAWEPNVLVRVVDSWLGIRGDMLITAATFELSETGRTTRLELVPPEAFALRAEAEERESEDAAFPLWE